MLESQLGQLGPDAVGVREVATDQLRAQQRDATAEAVKLLDSLEGGDHEPAGTSPSPLEFLARLRTLDLPPGEVTKALDRYVKDGTLPEAQPQALKPEAPAGIHPGSHQLDQRLKERDLGDDAYLTTLQEIQTEDFRRVQHGPIVPLFPQG